MLDRLGKLPDRPPGKNLRRLFDIQTQQAGFVRRFAFRLIEPDAGPIFHHFIGDITDGAI